MLTTQHKISELTQAQVLLAQGELVAIPTETVYGLAANAMNAQAVARIFEVKNRPTFDPLIVHTHSIEALERFAHDIPKEAYKLADAFMPGSLTLLLPKKNIIPDIVTAGLPTVGLRIPKHDLALELLRGLEFPLAAPSANPFGYISPTTAQHVRAQLGEAIAMVLDGGACSVGVESTIVGFPDGVPTILRFGGIALEEIEKVLGKTIQTQTHSSSNPSAPGMLASHYAPKKPFLVVEMGNLPALLAEVLPTYAPEKIGVLAYQTYLPTLPAQQQIVLSPTGNLNESAQKLFGAMRELDALPIEIIIAELVPQEGLGRAINDRLKRASVKA
jgi:L-threonylcarbamoyladenylate synthase